MTNTALMIYPEEKTARSVADLMNRQQPDFSWTTVRITLGWQVAKIQKLAPKPPKPLPTVLTENVAAALAKVGLKKPKAPKTIDIIVPVDHDTAKWIYFTEPLGVNPTGDLPWLCIPKANVLNRVQLDGKFQRLTVKVKAVQHYGLGQYAVKGE